MTPKDLANKLLAFYDNKPERWTLRANARLATMYPTQSHDPAAVCWCAVGALRKLGLGLFSTDVDTLAATLGVDTLPEFNDSCADFDEFRTKLEKVANS